MAKAEWQKTTELIEAAIKILEQENPMTVRQLFYRLVSVAKIENNRRDYKVVSEAMTKARGDGRVSWAWIVDRSRASYNASGWRDLTHFADTVEQHLRDYRRDYWQDQPTYVEIFTEKDAVTGSILPVTEEFGVHVYAIRGFNSTSNIQTTADRLLRHTAAGKRVTIFYMGDWDPSGADIERDLGARLRTFVLGETNLIGLFVERLAIFESDIESFRLPPLRVKEKDSRAASFVSEHGNQAVELDALPPTELRARIRDAIEGLIVRDAWDRAKRVEEAQRQTTQSIAARLREMIAGGSE